MILIVMLILFQKAQGQNKLSKEFYALFLFLLIIQSIIKLKNSIKQKLLFSFFTFFDRIVLEENR